MFNSNTEQSIQLSAAAQEKFSELPDEIIGYITHFLPLKEILEMRTVNKRWKGGIDHLIFHDNKIMLGNKFVEIHLRAGSLLDYFKQLKTTSITPAQEHNYAERLQTEAKVQIKADDINFTPCINGVPLAISCIPGTAVGGIIAYLIFSGKFGEMQSFVAGLSTIGGWLLGMAVSYLIINKLFIYCCEKKVQLEARERFGVFSSSMPTPVQDLEAGLAPKSPVVRDTEKLSEGSPLLGVL